MSRQYIKNCAIGDDTGWKIQIVVLYLGFMVLCLGFTLESVEVSKTMLMPGLHRRPIKSGDMTQTLLAGGVFWVFLPPT